MRVARVTVKMAKTAELLDGKTSIQGIALSNIVLVGCVRYSRPGANNVEYTIEDGTGAISVKIFSEKLTVEARYLRHVLI